MRKLLAIAFGQHRVLVAAALSSIFFVTFSSQLEMFAIGVMTSKQMGVGSSKISWILEKIEPHFPITMGMGYLAAFLILVALFRAVSLFCNRYLTRLVAINVSRDLRGRYFDHLQALPVEFFQSHNTGALSSRVVGDSSLIAEAVSSCLNNYFQTPFVVISSLLLCFYTSWQLSLIIFIGFPAIILPVVHLTKKVRRISGDLQKNKERFSSNLVDFLSGIQTIKCFAMEDFSRKKFVDQNDQMAGLEKKSSKYDLACRPVVHTIAMSFLAISLIWGLYGLQMSIADTLFFCGLLYVFYEPVKKFAEENSQIQRGLAAAERLFEVLEIRPKKQDPAIAIPLTQFDDSIVFDGVCFGYDERPVLNDISLTIQKGEMTAFVGPTGSGKSTLVQLLPRLWDPNRGEIRIDGKPLDKYEIRSLRDAIGFVPQRPFVFFDTVAQNIAFGRPYSRDEVIAAAKRAHAHEFIIKLPNGYDTQLAEGGKSLSGGQLQRLAIARALIKKSPILVMDEATSSLDAVSEALVKQAISELRGEATQIIIAHRLSTIEKADKIFYLDGGQIVASGTKEQLLKTCPPFQRMWESFVMEPV